MRGLKNALERQAIGLESVLSNRKRDRARKHTIRRTRARKHTIRRTRARKSTQKKMR